MGEKKENDAPMTMMECNDNDNDDAGSSSGGSSSNNKNPLVKAPVNVISYLHQMIYYAEALAYGAPKTSTSLKNIIASSSSSNSSDNGAEELVNILARTLLDAAQPTNLCSSLAVPDALLDNDDAEDAMQDDDDDDDDDQDSDDDEDKEGYPDNLPYQINPLKVKGGKPRAYTRTDALRSLLRALAPVAMDVGSRVASHVLLCNNRVGNTDNEEEMEMEEEEGTSASAVVVVEGEKERLQSLVLFGYWIPLAPQLVQIASDLFGEFQRMVAAQESLLMNGRNHNSVGGSACPLALLPFVASRLLINGVEKDQGENAAGVGGLGQIEEEAAVIAAEATNELLSVYCAKRYEHEFVKRWWDWDSCLFILIHAGKATPPPVAVGIKHLMEGGKGVDVDGDVVMSSDDDNDEKGGGGAKDDEEKEEVATKINHFLIGGYSPETNAPHLTNWKSPTFQMKWFASRAIGSLFALRPLPLTNLLKTLGVYEIEVPFVRHPWVIDTEDVVWEKALLRRVGRVVLPRVVKNEKIPYGQLSFGKSVDDSKNEEENMHHHNTDEDEHTSSSLFDLPSLEEVRHSIPLHPSLVHAGRGILLPRRGSIASYNTWCQSSFTSHSDDEHNNNLASEPSSSFVPTETTNRNMSLLGIAMCSDPHPPPILVCGPPGSGKSSVVREMARRCSSFASTSTQSAKDHVNVTCQEDELLELHVDEETDSKTLLGSFVATDIPGEFVWMAGPLTLAARSGRWVLIEDLDRCPEEIQAALIRLLEERILPLGVGKEEKCHPRFRLFGTCVTSVDTTSSNGANKKGGNNNARRKSVAAIGAGGKRILHPHLWRKVHVDPLPFTELREVGRLLHPGLPYPVADAVLDILRKLDKSGRGDDDNDVNNENDDNTSDEEQHKMTVIDKDILGHGARHASVREYIKLLSRISSALNFEPGSEYATESQRLICLAETVDIFAMSCPSLEKRRDFICQIAAPTWGLTADAATRYIESRIPTMSIGGHNNRRVEVGRARLLALKGEDEEDRSAPGTKRNFAETNHALRLMESVAVCASQNEPALLVGETGELQMNHGIRVIVCSKAIIYRAVSHALNNPHFTLYFSNAQTRLW